MNLELILAAALAGTGIPGAVALVGDRDGVRHAAAAGTRGDGGLLALDTVFQLASMTKAVTSVAAMQLVEAGKLVLDAPIAAVLPQLASPRVITGFADDGAVITRPAARAITLRHLLTHTSGFGYDFVHAGMARARGPNPPVFGQLAGLETPLLFDPGDDWAYGIGTDWVGQAVEAASGQRLDAYFAGHILGPLGMKDTAFHPSEPQRDRQAAMLARTPDGGLTAFPVSIGGGKAAEFLSGGGGLSGTGGDYLRFARMILNGGSLDGVDILRPGSVAEMSRNQIGALRAGAMPSIVPAFSHAIDWFPDQTAGWGLGFLINPEPGPNGRAAGSLAWAGIANTYYWIDPANGIAAVLLMQLLPFGDPGALAVLTAFERAVYAA